MVEMGAYVTALLTMILGVLGIVILGGLSLFAFAGLFILIVTAGPKFLKWVCVKCGAGHLFAP